MILCFFETLVAIVFIVSKNKPFIIHVSGLFAINGFMQKLIESVTFGSSASASSISKIRHFDDKKFVHVIRNICLLNLKPDL